ncbi:MAG: pentapeptide repeat-containing protein [Spirosomataceae bacterium]
MADFSRKEIIEKIMNIEKPINFSGVDFSEINLEGLDFSKTILNNTNFKNCNLNKIDFTEAVLKNIEFYSVKGIPYFKNTSLENIVFKTLEHKSEGEYKFQKCKLVNTKFSHPIQFEIENDKPRLEFLNCLIDTAKVATDLELKVFESELVHFGIPYQSERKFKLLIDLRKNKIQHCTIAYIEIDNSFSFSLTDNEFYHFQITEIIGATHIYSNKFNDGSFNYLQLTSGNFNHCHFKSVEFSKCELKHTYFERHEMFSCIFLCCSFDGLFFRGNEMLRVTLEADFTKCKIHNCTYKDSTLQASSYIDCEFWETKLYNSSISKVVFKNTTFKYCKIENTHFIDCTFEDVEIDNSNFIDVTFTNCKGHEKINVSTAKKGIIASFFK